MYILSTNSELCPQPPCSPTQEASSAKTNKKSATLPRGRYPANTDSTKPN